VAGREKDADDDAWVAEIERRIGAVESGESKGEAWEDVYAEALTRSK
jgi:hypothetical protein